MDAQATTSIMNPLIQWGFAGLCLILLGILVWLIRQLLEVLKENNRVIAMNTQAIQKVGVTAESTLEVAIELKNELLRRPCIAQFKVKKD